MGRQSAAETGRGPASPTLTALSSSALLLPAYAPDAAADAPPEFTEIGIRYSNYQEDALGAESVIIGARERYDIDVTQAYVIAPVGDSWSLGLDVQHDAMSGASPWFVGLTAEGQPGVAMSGASISDNRLEVSANTRYYFDRGSLGGGVLHSREDDYDARAVNVDGAFNSEDGLRTYSASVSASNDKVFPVQGVIPVRIDEERRQSRSVYVGVSQILTQTSLVRVGLSYTLQDGYLTDPYKFFDQRPDERNEWALGLGQRLYLPDWRGTLRADYRFYSDDWGVDAHTLRLEYSQSTLWGDITPYVRYYSQRQADFFSVIADSRQEFFADDYRLSSFGAVTLGMRWEMDVRNWRVSLFGERYQSDGDLGLGGGEEAPAIVDFWRFTLGMTYRFD
ncbi:MAG: DUF3570 domain-containing protein [Halieaceae bacterium]|jgi:hypothetical protein|nr:DUF3570 domain-containing protein [Halieaceae bacterium]